MVPGRREPLSRFLKRGAYKHAAMRQACKMHPNQAVQRWLISG